MSAATMQASRPVIPENKTKKVSPSLIAVYVLLIVLAVVWLLPVIYTVTTSFKSVAEFTSNAFNFLPAKWVLDNYVTLIEASASYPVLNWLGNNPYAWITIFVLVLWAGIGGNLVIYRSALSGVDESLYEAAKVDGAGPIRIFFSITLPEIKLPLFYTTIMTTTGAFNVWGQPVMLTNGGPNYQTQVLLMDIRNLAFPAGPAAAGMASAMALLLGIILMAIAAIQLIFMNKED